MSVLHIKLFTSFWNHRKTAKLRSLIGNDALWIMPRLWCYAADNQPDGDFSGYTAEEIALLIGYSSNAQAMLKAMLQACFFDSDMKLHDWDEHNGYHHEYAERAKKAARARWDRKKEAKKEIGEDRIGEETSNAPSITQALKFVKPTADEVKARFIELGVPDTEAESFLAYYESNGWKVGKNPMKSWTSACVTWKKNMRSYSQPKSKGYVP